MMKVLEAMKTAGQLFIEAGIDSPQLEAGMLMAHLLKCQRIDLYLDRDRTLDGDKVENYLHLIRQRLDGTPIHYIIGYREFMGLKFFVDSGVLIPRPDTEILVEYIIDHVKEGKSISPEGNSPIKILDLGTGSGAIAVSLAKYIKNSCLIAVDISPQALSVAQKNAIFHGVDNRIKFLYGDMLSSWDFLLEASEPQDFLDAYKFDIIVSNPPYIPTGDIENLSPQIKEYEPKLALDGGEDGLGYYKNLAETASIFLKDGGLLAVEIGYNQALDVKSIVKSKGFYKNIEVIDDLGGLNRLLRAEFWPDVD